MTKEMIAKPVEMTGIEKALEDNRSKMKEVGLEESAILGMSVLREAVGAGNHNLLTHIVDKSASAISSGVGGINLALESIHSQEPKDAVEARMISQASALYSQGMGMLAKMENTQRVDFMREYGNLAVKLLRAHNETMETLGRYRRGGEQKVTVVHVADKMAVVNNYGGRGSQENRGDKPCSL